MLMFDDPVDANALEKESKDEAAYFHKHPGCRAIIIPMWMVEKIHVDFCTTSGELVVQLRQEEDTKGEEDEGN